MGLPIEPDTYSIDPAHSQLGFAVTHLGISSLLGTFDRFTGELVVGETLANTSVMIDAEMASIHSGNSMRDEQLHGANYFDDVANHPTMQFRSTSITESRGEYTLPGDLTIKGTTLPVTFHVTYNGAAVFPMDGSTRHGFTAGGAISRSAFGVSYDVPVVSDEVKLSLNVEFVQPAAHT
ncbi:MAG: YceI family protein [Ilumatobacteraceae bacterium]